MATQKINRIFRLKPIILILVFINVTLPAFSQWHIENLTTDDGLPQNSIASMVQNKNGLLYLATMGGLVSYDGISFKLVNTPGSNRIHHVFQNARGDIFFYNSDFELFHFTNHHFHVVDTKKYLYPLIKNIMENYMNPHEFYHLIMLNRMWLNKTADGFFTIEPTVLNFNSLKGNGALIGHKILLATPKGFEIIDRDFKTSSVIKATNFEVDYAHLEKNAAFLSHGDDCYFIYKNALHHLYVDGHEIMVKKIINSLPNECELIRTIYVPNNSNTVIYIGTENNGLFKFTKKQFNVVTAREYKINELPSNKQSIQELNIIYSQLEISPGEILIGNGATVKNNVIHFPVKEPRYNIQKILYKDSLNRLWNFGSGVLTQMDKKGKTIYNCSFKNSPFYENMIQFKDMYYGSNNNKFYACTFYKDTFYKKYDFTLESKALIEKLVPTQDSLLQIWTRKGMYVLNINNKKINKSKLPDLYYRNVLNTSRLNEKIVTSYGHGWFYFKNDTLIRLPEDRHGYLNTAHEILRDDHGMLWISTNNGLFLSSEQDIFDYIDNKKEHIYLHRFTKKMGFNTNEFNGGDENCAIKLSDGTFSFSSMNGLVQFDPLSIKTYLPVSNLHVSDIAIDNTKHYTPFSDSLVLKPDYKTLDLAISTQHFDHLDNLYLYWKLEGYRDTWTKLDPANLNILIPQLKTGNFTLQIKKLTGFGKDNHIVKEIKITVLPFWYQTSWGMALIIFSILFFLYIINLLNTKRLGKQKQHLEKLIDDRNHELVQINQDLKETISHNNMLISVIVHDIKAPVTFINQITQGVRQKWDMFNQDDIKKMIHSVEESSEKITSFIHTFLTWASAKKENSRDTALFSLSSLINDIFNFHRHNDKIRKGNIYFDNQVPDPLMITQNKELLHIVLNNLIENSLKFTTKGSIKIHYKKYATELIISCTDTGRGMTALEIQTLMAEKYNPNSLRSDSFRLGYFFIKDILPIINGKMEITSEVGNGTTVNLIFSIDNNIFGFE